MADAAQNVMVSKLAEPSDHVMEMLPVQSSNIQSVGYDPETRTMRVAFKGGTEYEYPGTLPDEHQALIHAPSIGKHLYEYHIKPGAAFMRVK
jgi:hypothetical protein